MGRSFPAAAVAVLLVACPGFLLQTIPDLRRVVKWLVILEFPLLFLSSTAAGLVPAIWPA